MTDPVWTPEIKELAVKAAERQQTWNDLAVDRGKYLRSAIRHIQGLETKLRVMQRGLEGHKGALNVYQDLLSRCTEMIVGDNEDRQLVEDIRAALAKYEDG